jgi:hypothetical protein
VLFEGPSVDRVAVANQLEQAWLAELHGGPLVHGLQPRHDHRVVEQPAKALLVGDVALYVEGEGIAVREHAAEREKDAGHPEPRVAEQATERSEPAECKPRCPDECMRVEDADKRNVHEEALRCALRFGEVAVLEVGAHDARVVSQVSVAPRRFRDELQPLLDGPRRRFSRQGANERDGFASVPQQSLVHRPPPHAAGRGGIERIEHSAVHLPAHERQRRPSERQVVRGPAGRPVIRPREQGKARHGIVARGRDLRLGRGEGRQASASRESGR